MIDRVETKENILKKYYCKECLLNNEKCFKLYSVDRLLIWEDEENKRCRKFLGRFVRHALSFSTSPMYRLEEIRKQAKEELLKYISFHRDYYPELSYFNIEFVEEISDFGFCFAILIKCERSCKTNKNLERFYLRERQGIRRVQRRTK